MDLPEFLREQAENQILTGGVTVVAFGAILTLCRQLPGYIWSAVKRRLVTTVDVADHDQAFFWVERWLSQQPAVRDRGRLLTASTRQRPSGAQNEPSGVGVSDSPKRRRVEIEVVFTPAPGVHLIRTGGKLVLIAKERHEVEDVSSGVAYHETLTFTARSRATVESLIYEARALASPPDDPSVDIMRAEGWHWRVARKRPPRPVESVVLDDGIMESIVADVKRFVGSSDWYARHSIPYQRGYLLHGPPGTGKTSLVLAIATMLGRDVYAVRASATTDEAFESLLAGVPEHGIVLIEDVDCMFVRPAVDDELPGGKVKKHQHLNVRMSDTFLTFSGFLNSIDGVSAPEGRILFLTTNRIDALNGALIRPGRVDRRFHIGNASPGQAERLFLRFFPGADVHARAFGDAVRALPEPPSMAQLQEHILSQALDHEAASRLPRMLPEAKTADVN